MPNSLEQHGRVNNEHLSQNLRVVVLSDLAGQLNQAISSLVEDLHGHVLQIQDTDSLLHPIPSNGRTSRKSELQKDLIRLDEVLHHSLLGGDLEDLVDIQMTHSFDVDVSPLPVGLMVKVRVKLLDCSFFLEVKVL